MSALDLFDFADAVLTASVEALDLLPAEGLAHTPDAVTLLGAPDRRYVWPGLPAFDCEQVVVHMEDLTEAQTGSAAGTRSPSLRPVVGRVNEPQLVVSVIRCVPTVDNRGGSPTATQQHDAARQILADVWVVWNHLYRLARNDELFDRCKGIVVERGLPYRAAGGFGGCAVVIRPPLQGYQPA